MSLKKIIFSYCKETKNIRIKLDEKNLEHIFSYQMKFSTPYFFLTDYNTWRNSFSDDVDGEVLVGNGAVIDAIWIDEI